jgi:predicted NBD/HSP70 family sugar kinase
VLADFSGAITARETLRIATYDADAGGFGNLVAGEIATFLTRHKVRRAKVARIAVAVQGVANSQEGTIVWSPAFARRNIPVCAPVTRRLGIACTIANDANLMAEALIGSDPARFSGTAAIVFIGYGVGMGLIINGQVYHGATGAASEFGHMNHLPHGPLCRCGRRGCVEAYAADYAIVRLARGSAQDEPPLQTRVPEEELLALEGRARAGDAAAAAAFAQAGEALGYGIARMVAVVSPEHVLLAGPGTRAIALIEPSLREAFTEALVEELRRNVVIDTIPVDKDMIVRGGIADALHHLDREVYAPGLPGAEIA